MKQDKEGSFKLTFSRDDRTGHFLKEEADPFPRLTQEGGSPVYSSPHR